MSEHLPLAIWFGATIALFGAVVLIGWILFRAIRDVVRENRQAPPPPRATGYNLNHLQVASKKDRASELPAYDPVGWDTQREENKKLVGYSLENMQVAPRESPNPFGVINTPPLTWSDIAGSGSMEFHPGSMGRIPGTITLPDGTKGSIEDLRRFGAKVITAPTLRTEERADGKWTIYTDTDGEVTEYSPRDVIEWDEEVLTDDGRIIARSVTKPKVVGRVIGGKDSLDA